MGGDVMIVSKAVAFMTNETCHHRSAGCNAHQEALQVSFQRETYTIT